MLIKCFFGAIIIMLLAAFALPELRAKTIPVAILLLLGGICFI